MIQQSYGQVPSYECTQGFGSMNCQLSNINQTSSMKSFNIVPFREPFAIKGVYIICSKMETLTEDVCKALPYVKNFHAEQLGLAFVEQNTFQKCTKVEVISLYGNSLKKLPFGLFDSNVQLSVVQLAVNKLMEIDGNMLKIIQSWSNFIYPIVHYRSLRFQIRCQF